MNTLYGQSPPRDKLIDAYNTFAAEYYGELAFWQTPTGKALTSLFMAGTVGDYDDYVQEVNCNPYYTSIYLTNNPQVSRLQYSLKIQPKMRLQIFGKDG